MSSLVLGFIGLIVAFLPVLGIPISACGLALGILGLIAAALSRGASLRWSLAGFGVCALSMLVNSALAWVPVNDLPGKGHLKQWPAVPDRPYVAPPARG
jgi:hypothetical protein